MKTKSYKVAEINATDEIVSLHGSVFDTKESAENYIQGFEGDFHYLTILEIWD